MLGTTAVSLDTFFDTDRVKRAVDTRGPPAVVPRPEQPTQPGSMLARVGQLQLVRMCALCHPEEVGARAGGERWGIAKGRGKGLRRAGTRRRTIHLSFLPQSQQLVAVVKVAVGRGDRQGLLFGCCRHELRLAEVWHYLG